MVICLERGANNLHVVQLMPLPPHHLLLQQNAERFILLVPAYPGCHGKKTVKRLCVCLPVAAAQSSSEGIATRSDTIVLKSFEC